MDSYVPNLLALDVGAGNVKVGFKNSDGTVNYKVFPSIALPIVLGSADSPLEKRDTLSVIVNNKTYEIGVDAGFLQTESSVQIANHSYFRTDPYLALARGAFVYANKKKIDLLVVGLPVYMSDKYSKELESILVGHHEISANTSVWVEKVLVLPQPIGGLLNYALSQESYGLIKNSKTLIVDPGYHTFDWVVAKGIKIFPNLSGSHSTGMHSVLTALARSLSKTTRSNNMSLTDIDEGIRMGDVKIFGKSVDMTEHWKAAKTQLNEPITALKNSVGEAAGVHNIILVGGAAPYFKPSISEAFPDHDIVICDKPMLSNVMGFFRAGERFMAKEGMS